MCIIACNSDSGTPPKAAPSAPTLAEVGETIFRTNCAACHNPKADMVGPKMVGVISRWDGDTVQLKAFIKNPAKLINEKEPHAVTSYKRFAPTMMTAFPLSDQDFTALFAYFRSIEE